MVRLREQIVTLFKNIERLDDSLEKHIDDDQSAFAEVRRAMDAISDRYAHHLPPWAVAIISLLTAAVAWFARG
ncbi:MAG: hypothetical protein AB1327_08165 [Bacillota bacterium]